MPENWIIKTYLAPLHLVITPKEGSFISAPLRTYDSLWFPFHPCVVEPLSLELTKTTSVKRKTLGKQWYISLCCINSVAFLPLGPLQEKTCSSNTFPQAGTNLSFKTQHEK